jgi:type II secretory pathway component PulM
MTIPERLRESWSNASMRERVLVVVGALIVVGAIAHAFVWEPLLLDLASTDRRLSTARGDVEGAQRTVNELAGLRREARTPRTPDPRAAAERVVDAAGLRNDLTAISVGDGSVRLTFAAVDFVALNALIEQLGRDEQLFVAEALLAARVAPGSVRAELAMTRPTTR